jgi:hypothetical protein
MCIVSGLRLKAIQEACYGSLGVPLLNQCQYHHANGQWAILVRISLASLLETMWVMSINGPQIADSI